MGTAVVARSLEAEADVFVSDFDSAAVQVIKASARVNGFKRCLSIAEQKKSHAIYSVKSAAT